MDRVRVAIVALTVVASACAGKAAPGMGGAGGQSTGGSGAGAQSTGGSGAGGQSTGGTGSGGTGGRGTGGRGSGGDGGGVGGTPADAAVLDAPGSDAVADAGVPEVLGEACGSTRCQPGYPCCACFGFSCSLIPGTCPAVACPSIPCGTTTCTPGVAACVHPPRGGTCTIPDAGQCPPGTAPESSGGITCCLAPDKPKCVAIDRACDGTGVSCSCFSVDPCGSSANACSGALIQGGDIQCRAG
jgi:hypothetical protein